MQWLYFCRRKRRFFSSFKLALANLKQGEVINLLYTIQEQAAQLEAIKNKHGASYVESMFLYSTAPVIRRAKPAVLFRMGQQYMPAFRQRQNALCRATNLKVMEMSSSEKSVLLFVYEEANLEKALRKNLAVQILHAYGYIPDEQSLSAMLAYLKGRLQDESFPHEIGLFLGYPPDDVQSFIANGGQNCMLCRYWKVYHNLERAQETFRRIDEAQSYALHLLDAPLPLHVAANRLKAM